jgi:hypothetical protein
MDVITATTVMAAQVCPQAPPGAVGPTNEITGYILWGVFWLFRISIATGIAAIVAGRVFSLPHASKVGVISLVVVFLSGLAYLVLPSVLDGLLGKGCL